MKSLVLYLFFVIQLYCFGLSFIPSTIAKGLAIVTLVTALLLSDKKVIYFNKPLLGLLVACLINMVWCSINRDQTPIEFLIGSEITSMSGILVLFAMPAFKLGFRDIEQVLKAVCITCISIYLAQYIFHIPLLSSERVIEARGFDLRARINGQCLFPLFYLYSLQHLLHKWNWYDAILLTLNLLCIFILGFRSHIAVLVIITLFYLWKKAKMNGRFILGGGLLFSVLFVVIQTGIIQFKIQQMTERNETENFENANYIRYRTYYYYTEYAPRNNVDRVLGIGLPNANSVYGKQIQKLKMYNGIVWADWGLIGLAWVLGIPAVLCIIWYSLKASLTPMRGKMSYLCYWFLFMLVSSVVTREIYRIGAFPIQGVVLYLIAEYRIGNAKLDIKQIWKRR